MDDDEKTYDPASSGIDSLDRLILLEESEAIRKCLESKADSESLKTWRMKKIEGLSYKDISITLSIPEGTVGRRINRVKLIIVGCTEGHGL